MKYKKTTIFFLFLIFIAPALSVQTLIQQNIESQASIIYPKDTVFEYNSTFNFHLYFVNSSNYVLNASMFECIGHFLDTQNNLILNLNSINDLSEGIDDYFIINQSLTNTIQSISYNIFCNSTQQEAAYISGNFQITNDSEEKYLSADFLISIIVLIPLIFGLFMIIGAATLGIEHNVLRIILFLLSPITIFVSFHFAMIGLVRFYGLFELQESIGSTTYWMAWWFFTLLSYFLIYFIWKWADTIAQKKNERINY